LAGLFLNLAERLQLLKLAKVTKALFPIEAGHRSRPRFPNALASANRWELPNGSPTGRNPPEVPSDRPQKTGQKIFFSHRFLH
jgi:hypothetical protein